MNDLDSTLETVEMSEIDGLEQEAVLRYMSVPKKCTTHEMLELNTCIGDLYVTVNALYDYAGILEQVTARRELDSYQKELYLFYAARCRRIAEKFSRQIGYDYDKALERCWKRRAKESGGDDRPSNLYAYLHCQISAGKRHPIQYEAERPAGEPRNRCHERGKPDCRGKRRRGHDLGGDQQGDRGGKERV